MLWLQQLHITLKIGSFCQVYFLNHLRVSCNHFLVRISYCSFDFLLSLGILCTLRACTLLSIDCKCLITFYIVGITILTVNDDMKMPLECYFFLLSRLILQNYYLLVFSKTLKAIHYTHLQSRKFIFIELTVEKKKPKTHHLLWVLKLVIRDKALYFIILKLINDDNRNFVF